MNKQAWKALITAGKYIHDFTLSRITVYNCFLEKTNAAKTRSNIVFVS